MGMVELAVGMVGLVVGMVRLVVGIVSGTSLVVYTRCMLHLRYM